MVRPEVWDAVPVFRATCLPGIASRKLLGTTNNVFDKPGKAMGITLHSTLNPLCVSLSKKGCDDDMPALQQG